MPDLGHLEAVLGDLEQDYKRRCPEHWTNWEVQFDLNQLDEHLGRLSAGGPLGVAAGSGVTSSWASGCVMGTRVDIGTPRPGLAPSGCCRFEQGKENPTRAKPRRSRIVSHARLAFVPSFPAARWLAISCMLLAGAAAAQGVVPPAAGGDKPFGGFEPVLNLRTYYLDQESLTGAPASAWALGGWAGLRSPWWGDMFQVGLVGYTSLKLYGPDDKDGTRLLAPGQETITVLGEAFGAVRILGQTFTGYRQRINRPFINIQDNRMVPNTFEAYTLTGAASDVSYTGGYITKIKKRDAEHFVWMSDGAGGSGDHKGTAFAGATWDFVKNGYVRADFQATDDVFNTLYADGKYPIALDEQTVLALGAQYIRQKSVGAAQIGNFSTWGAGLQATIARGPFGGQLYYTQTGKGFDTQNPYGDHPSYLNLMQVAFNTAGEQAWGIGGNVNFASLGAPGLTAAAVYASGHNRVNATTGAPIPKRDETNVRADYAFAKGTVLEGLVATLRYSWLHQDGSPQTAPQLRAYVNYDVRF